MRNYYQYGIGPVRTTVRNIVKRTRDSKFQSKFWKQYSVLA